MPRCLAWSSIQMQVFLLLPSSENWRAWDTWMGGALPNTSRVTFSCALHIACSASLLLFEDLLNFLSKCTSFLPDLACTLPSPQLQVIAAAMTIFIHIASLDNANVIDQAWTVNQDKTNILTSSQWKQNPHFHTVETKPSLPHSGLSSECATVAFAWHMAFAHRCDVWHTFGHTALQALTALKTLSKTQSLES